MLIKVLNVIKVLFPQPRSLNDRVPVQGNMVFMLKPPLKAVGDPYKPHITDFYGIQ